jgi:hypothetical protein
LLLADFFSLFTNPPWKRNGGDDDSDGEGFRFGQLRSFFTPASSSRKREKHSLDDASNGEYDGDDYEPDDNSEPALDAPNYSEADQRTAYSAPPVTAVTSGGHIHRL